MTWHPAHLDGCSLVVLRRRGSLSPKYEVVESGWLTFDGEELRLESGGEARALSADEIAALQPVVYGNRIPACSGFKYFAIWPSTTD